jgi:hypothetical protein
VFFIGISLPLSLYFLCCAQRKWLVFV